MFVLNIVKGGRTLQSHSFPVTEQGESDFRFATKVALRMGHQVETIWP